MSVLDSFPISFCNFLEVCSQPSVVVLGRSLYRLWDFNPRKVKIGPSPIPLEDFDGQVSLTILDSAPLIPSFHCRLTLLFFSQLPKGCLYLAYANASMDCRRGRSYKLCCGD